jgi:hypothetical protein
MAVVLVQDVEMIPVDVKLTKLIESVGYVEASRQLIIKFYHTSTHGLASTGIIFCFNNVPHFRFQGLLNAARKDAYYETFIKDHFLAKDITLEIALPPPT